MIQSNKSHYSELDGVRGYAALTVFFSHFMGFLKETPFVNSLQASPIRFFWNGEAAVNLFFVLSGFVLSLSLLNKRKSYLEFVFSRFFRIYPAYYFSIILALLCIFIFIPQNLTGLSSWANSFWHEKINFSELVQHLILVGKPHSRLINPVIWSLAIEMKMSLFMPFFIGLLHKRSLQIQLITLVFAYILGCTIGFFYFLPQFFLGGLLALHFNKIIDFIKYKSNALALLILIVSLVLYSNKYFAPIISEKSEKLGTYLSGLGSLGVIISILTSEILKNYFSNSTSKFLGKISYSFYLIHLPVMLLTFSIFYKSVPSVILCGSLSLAISILISSLMFQFIEGKGVLLGKILYNYLFLKRNESTPYIR